MTKVALGLYIFWIILLILKYISMEKDSSFSYFRVFFGKIAWYRNSRVLILLIGLFLVEIFLPLKQIYLLFFITGCIIILMTFANFKFKAGRIWSNLIVLLIGICVTGFSSLFVF
ncbi:hypothetical protein [Liquorilactobacillus mali]|uniref:hypothetical protein n=1 Tax=Liquorilactobacillus mali TaxID=1618 RepID=UPI0002492E3F|nr:hypothetical protein [Liquorilactobacillus mali]EJE98559.1 hypothetical protein LMA_07208 [Liquorilactobacillus mali KCTC 3596 = DSM 20444]MDC7952112.1 hypothetical protein [Liquorilactobacillus mali]MDV7756959.1 hypothetical protein [Liquorilactobacillus mali]QFQ74798.1 hypothetical protein LM596_06580 [Liquorilactobacillus mali]